MQITTFQIAQNRLSMNIIINDAASVTSLKFWTKSTYKQYAQSIDLTSKLTGAATDNITVTLADLALTYFDGVYFLEAEDSDEISNSITGDLTRYKECILNKVLEYSVCEECLKDKSISLINAQSLLYSLETGITQGYINEIVNISNALDKYCSNTCQTCGEYQNIINNNYYSTT
jgi:hypothetical protein